jgi:tRNA dimethylallyltransferase
MTAPWPELRALEFGPGTSIAVLGATATGKSGFAMALIEGIREHGAIGEIVNADALAVYRHLDIGTAKPSLRDRERVRHHLIDVLDPDQAFSAGLFSRLGREAIAGILERAGRPFVVGGSGLYLRALFEGLVEVPRIDPELRQRLRTRAEHEGIQSLFTELERCDPEIASRIEVADSQRILRALEVYLATGKPLSAWQRKKPTAASLPVAKLGLTLDRAILYDRIESRVIRMVQSGWLEEVESLLESLGSFASEPPAAFQAIGYRELARHLSGEWTLQEAIDRIIIATRQYAKRQETWFRKEPDVTWIDASRLEDVLPDVVSAIVAGSTRPPEG